MRVITFASGSGGNCALVSAGDTHILLDAGISCRRIREQLSLTGLAPENLSAILITHEHSEHISGLSTLAKRCLAPIFAPPAVARALERSVPGALPVLRAVNAGEPFPLGSVTVRAFHTPHDTPESVGWRLDDSLGGSFALATDMGCVTEEIREGLLGAETVLIEANHDPDLLRAGPYPYPLKRRILSDRGHLSNADSALLAAFLAARGTRYIILGHLSRENNTPELAFRTVSAALAGSPARLFVAPAAERLTVEVAAEASRV